MLELFGPLAEVIPALGAGRIAVVVFRIAIGTVDDVPHPQEPPASAHSAEDVALAGADVTVFSISAIRMGREPAFSLTAGTLHHGAILDHSIDRKSLGSELTGWFFMRASTHARGAALRAAGTGCSLTPGLSPFRNSIPAFSSVESTCESVDVREPISP